MSKTPLQRWCSKVELPADPEGCWEWRGYRLRNYGRFWPGGNVGRRRLRYDIPAYRYGYERFVGPIPEGLHLDHLCRNPGCVNPDHLEAVTCKENLRRAPHAPSTINEAKTHCVAGHPLSGDNLTINVQGSRVCKACSYQRKKRYLEGISLGIPPRVSRKTHCKHGHELSGDNVYIGRASRVCRACHRASSARYYAKKVGGISPT